MNSHKSNNMNTKRFRLVSISLLISLICNFSFSQGSATVSGVIKDASTGSTLPGAAVIIEGMNRGTITDNYGKYILTGVPEGENVLLFTYIGYKDQPYDVTIVAGQNQKVDIMLEVEAYGVEEVVITHQLMGQTKAINQQLNADALVNVVSEDKIKELPDVNAAEAIGRIPGVSLLRSGGEGTKVVIRGLEPRFSAITINGVRVPSNAGTDRSVDLSMISPELLQGIEVFKSPTPDMDAEAVGGTVNLVLKKAPDTPKLQLRAGSGYNVMHNDFKDYYFSGSYSRRFFMNRLGMIVQANTDRINRSSEVSGYGVQSGVVDGVDKIVEYDGLSLTMYDAVRKKYGGSINLDLNLNNGGDISLFSFISSTDRESFKRNNSYNYPAGTAFLNAGSYAGNSTLFSNMLSGHHTLGIVKIDWSTSYAKTESKTPTSYNINLYNAEAYLGKGYEDDTQKWVDSSTVSNDTVAYLQELESRTTEISEATMTSLLNVEIPFSIGNDIAASIKFGGKYNVLNRESFYTRHVESLYDLGINVVPSWDPDYPHDYYLNSNNRVLLKTFTNPDYTPETILGGDYMFDNPISEERADNWHDYFGDNVRNDRNEIRRNLDLHESVLAGYLMGKIKYRSLLTVIAGVRVEQSDNSYDTYISSIAGTYGQFGDIRDTITYQKYTEVLPHLHFKFEPTRWYALRLSAAKTLARPNYNMIAYAASVQDLYKNINTGNPNLKHMTSMNYDISMSFYDGKYGLLTIGGFYKDIKNNFYRNSGIYFHNDSIAAAYGWPGKIYYRFSSYANSPQTTVYGFEIDLQTSLKFLPAPFNGLVLGANFTRLYSTSTYHTNAFITTDSLIFIPPTPPYFFQYSEPRDREITMPGQTPYIFNLVVSYEYKGFTCRVSGNSQGQYLTGPGSSPSGLFDNHRIRFWRWDLAMSQQITKNLQIYFNANNFTNMRETTHYNANEYYIKSETFTGVMLSYGLRLDF